MVFGILLRKHKACVACYQKQNDKRWRRIVLNDVENIPLGLVVAWGSANIAQSPRTHVGLVSLFAVSRYGRPRILFQTLLGC
jgi:hypothetical protein